MKKLSTYLFLILFSFSAPSFADDIRDLEIEGMSVGDSLLDFFDKDIINQEKKLNNVKKNLNIINSNLMKGEISIHTSTTYHSSGPNVSNKDRVGMVVHFCTDRAERVIIKGENSQYLNQLEDELRCPILYSDDK